MQFTNVSSFTAPPLLLTCEIGGGFTNGVSVFFLNFGCSAINAQGVVTYICDVDGDSKPCEWNVNIVLLKYSPVLFISSPVDVCVL